MTKIDDMKNNEKLPEIFATVESNKGPVKVFTRHAFCPICGERLEIDEHSLPSRKIERVIRDDCRIYTEEIKYRLRLYCPNCHTTVEINEISNLIFTTEKSNGEITQTVI